MKRDDPTTAERLTRESLQLRESTLGAHHPMLSPGLVVLGNALSLQPGRELEARAALERALSIVEATQGKDHCNAAFPLAGLGQLDVRAGDHATARPRLSRAIELLEAADYGADLEMRARIELANVEWADGHKDLGIETARSALQAASTREPDAVPTIEAWLRTHGGLPQPPANGEP
ncbi:MAG: tetratricopeptide repeat protein, partial [Nannocystaceae bacterium]|nr:tetratricopeptide repeat protein [Nannocystaceae bacterium]